MWHVGEKFLIKDQYNYTYEASNKNNKKTVQTL